MANNIGNVSAQPYYLKTPEFFMIAQERQRHDEPIYQYGEYAMFVLLWNAIDYANGLVQRCPQCYNTNDAVSRVYNQPSYAMCDLCYGSMFFLESAGVGGLGGMKARLVRPCMWNPTDEYQKLVATGEIITATTSVQSVSDFRMRTGDFILKADGTRWRVARHETDSIISGFQAANDIRAMTGYNYPLCTREDESTPAFLAPPDTATVMSLLDTSIIPNWPVDFSSWEVVNGGLISDDYSNTQQNNPAPAEGN